MAGTIPLSLTQQFDIYGKPLSGGQLFLIQAGTVATPQSGFQDTALTFPLPNPISLNAAGRVPQFFLADGSIKVRLTDKNGIVQLAADSILVIGPSAGGGITPSVDPTTLIQTGNIIARYGTGTLAGYVRLNGLTIGSATSGATERANADCQAAFQFLWNTDPNLPVSTGRGASASADWVANKTLTLPDGRGSVISALDDMGNTAAGKYTGVSFISGNGTTLGARLGAVTQTVARSQLPNVTLGLSGSVPVSVNSGNTHVPQASPGFGGLFSAQGGASVNGAPYNSAGWAQLASTGSVALAGGATVSINGNVTQAALPTIQPTILATIYLKL